MKHSIKAASKRPLNQHTAMLRVTSVPTKLKAMHCIKQALDDRPIMNLGRVLPLKA